LVGRGGMPTATTAEHDLPFSKEVMALPPNRLVSGGSMGKERLREASTGRQGSTCMVPMR